MCAEANIRVHKLEPAPMAREEHPIPGGEVKEVTDVIEELRQMVSELKAPRHVPGLCESTSCPECRDSRKRFAKVVLTRYELDLRRAAEFYGLNEMNDSLIAAHAKWIFEGRPVAAPSEPNAYVVIDGLRIVG